jgi:hypothetical protein
VCLHTVIREKVYPVEAAQEAPETFVSMDARFKCRREYPGAWRWRERMDAGHLS